LSFGLRTVVTKQLELGMWGFEMTRKHGPVYKFSIKLIYVHVESPATNFEFMSEKFEVVQVYANGSYAQKSVSK
jgi:hypothetical protein